MELPDDVSEPSGGALITIIHDVNVAAPVGSFAAPWPIRQPIPTTRSSRPGFLASMAQKLTTRAGSGLVAVRFTVIDALRY